MNAEQIAAAVVAGIQGILPALQQQQQQQPPAPPAVQFAVSPARAQQAVLDYNTAAGAKIFSKATEALPTTFSLRDPNIRVLISELQTNTTTFGWDEIMHINVAGPAVANPDLRNILLAHGRITLEQCNEHCATYINTQVRNTQNNYQLYVCLTRTVDDETKQIMANESSKFTIGTPETPCGISYLKLLLSKAEVDTRATSAQVRRNLTRLDEYMVTIADNDIIKFNNYVRNQMARLSSREAGDFDIITYLLDGYRACTDKKFSQYMEDQNDAYNEGAEFTVETLMVKAETKFATRQMTNDWNKPTEEQEELIALKAEMKLLKRAPTARRRTDKNNDAEEPARSRKRTPKDQKEPKKKTFRGKWKWRGEKPGPDDPQEKVFEDQTWYYCDNHGWCKHLTKSCRSSKPDELTAALAEVGIEDVDESENESDAE